LPYIAPELAIKYIEQEWDNKQAIVGILDMLIEEDIDTVKGYGQDPRFKAARRVKAELLRAKLVGGET
jgi:hypothetical protein